MGRRGTIRLARLATAAACLAVAATAPAGAAPENAYPTLPNLKPLPPYGINMGTPDAGSPTQLPRALRLSLTAQNIGNWPLDLRSSPSQDPNRPHAMQCVIFRGPRDCMMRQPALHFLYHSSHGHYHVEGYANYELRLILPDRSPDLSPGGLVGRGTKASFCLLDLQRHTRHPEDPYTDTGYFRGCGPDSQGISQGWADIYSSGLGGQQILLDGVPDGDYSLVIQLNPYRKLYETTYSDNVSWQNVRISNNRTLVTPIA